MINDGQRAALRCLSDGLPKWGKEIAEYAGMTKWSQIATGTMYGHQLVAKGLAIKEMRCGESGIPRMYFYITDAGKDVLAVSNGDRQ